MASGIPVICAKKPPMSEIVENGGITFNLNDAKDLSKKIIELLTGIKYEVIPIQKLVRVQIGSAFITLENLSKNHS